MSVISLIQAIVRDELRRLHIGDLGVVTSVFPHSDDSDRDNYACNVLLKNSGLELRKVPVATPMIGGVAIPNIEDLVLVTFVGGELNQPIIIGRLYNDQQRPPVNQSNELIHHLPLEADEETALRLTVRSGGDHDPLRQVEMRMGSTLTVQLTDGDPLISVTTEQATIQVAPSGDIRIETQSKLVLTAAGGLDLKSDGSINIEAGGPMTLKGATIDLN
jgi:phage baseplate assembly protein gpV